MYKAEARMTERLSTKSECSKSETVAIHNFDAIIQKMK